MKLSRNTLGAACIGLSLMPAAQSAKAQDLADYLSQHGYSAIAMNKLATGHETVTVEINGVSGWFVLDSGAGATVIHSARLAKYELASTEAVNSSIGIGAGGQSSIMSHDIQSLRIDGAALNLPQVRSMDLSGVVEALTAATGTEIDGVIGQDVLTRYQGVIDVKAQQLFLRPEPR